MLMLKNYIFVKILNINTLQLFASEYLAK